MNLKPILSLGIIVFLFAKCTKDFTPKPRGELRLDYPQAAYQKYNPKSCAFTFEHSVYSKIVQEKNDCWYTIHYPKMKSNIHLTYQSVNQDLAKKIKESERLAHEHSVKASYILPSTFAFAKRKVYGTLFEIGGETAVNHQFHVTDSVSHLISGSVYFTTEPNPDSLAPAIEYMKKDVRHLIESIQWR